ncbi:hypothetical protein TVAG_034780 [Trichomonas vaginalis G3]|uniref:Uncharacterized protein n=1 Tax=Trichomonas vaginalis (strain ATCC PRA-98 / G3) TaxID=412133 RepID=A2DAF2_TRIV3|nr:D-aminoacylase, C-terminal region-containing protein [Trichomonas vaginalis G3]EAY22455.1 hypothetical protein TVAG_034780 [Trichomonas vaginalis G3]KAI5497179.1 D-aminoacylase, C-terminal region-containing protein [Trichomonas vaginalis G3]|eukprot:XP_001583441.1 hypothetical protein [Trichomonas vaginalis G3]
MDREHILYDNYWVSSGSPSKIVITRGAPSEMMEKNLVELSGKTDEREVLEWTLDLIARGITPLANFYAINEKDMLNIMPKDYVMMGSDSDVYYEGYGKTVQHPRNMASHSVFLRKYVKELDVLSLEKAVNKMSGLIADRFGINDRGKVFVGNYADLNMFKLDEINDTTKETGWTWPSTGMKYVMNSGEFLIDDYKMTGNLPGKGLRKTDYVNQKKIDKLDDYLT